MALIMVVQGSGRRNGYTASLMKNAVESLQDVEGVEAEIFHLHDYKYGPCTSCFSCIRNIGSGCVLDDDWGRKGEGILYKAFKRANALLMVDPVHGWGMCAASYLFLERVYPTFFEGTPYGMPYAAVSCASNQGFQYRAIEEHCKQAASHAFKFIGSVPVHAAYIDKARLKVSELAVRLSMAALEDEREGRKKLTDEELFLHYLGTPWEILEGYLKNITDLTMKYEDSIPVNALNEGTFTIPEAHEHLEKTCQHLKKAIELYNQGDHEASASEFTLVAKYWTNATYIQLCAEYVKAEKPKNYRPLDEA